MNIRFIIIIMITILFAGCGNSVNFQDCTSNRVASTELISTISEHKTILDNTYSPYGVSEVFIGSEFDYNFDNVDDFPIIYNLYGQYCMIIVDGSNYQILLDHIFMTEFNIENTKTQIFVDKSNYYAIKSTNITTKSSYTTLVETIEILKTDVDLILEGVYDKDTGELLHAFEFNCDEYYQKQNDCLAGFRLFKELIWVKWEKRE